MICKRTYAWVLPSRCLWIGTTRSNSTAAPACSPGPGATSTRSGSLGNTAGAEGFNPVTEAGPDLMGSRTSLTLYEGMTDMMDIYLEPKAPKGRREELDSYGARQSLVRLLPALRSAGGLFRQKL